MYTPSFTRKHFEKLTKRQQRVLIAEDVIARLDANQLRALAGVFVHTDTVRLHASDVNKDVINKQVCTVCAKGALTCSWLGGLNKHHLANFCLNSKAKHNVGNSGTKELLSTFGDRLYEALESVFEGWAVLSKQYKNEMFGKTKDKNYRVRAFNRFVASRKGFNATANLRYLMNNLIKNKGRLRIPGINKKASFYIGS